LSGSTLREACSWGKVETVYEQMVFSEATLSLPVLASYALSQGSWRARKARKYNALLNEETTAALAPR